MEKRLDKAIKVYQQFPEASIEFRLVNILIDRFTWDQGLSKLELARIVYPSQLRSKELHMSQAQIRISSIMANIRKKYSNLLIYASPHINPKTGKREWRLFCNWENEDIRNILKMLERIIDNMENAKETINAENQKSKEKRISEYERLVQKLKIESDRKRKKMK